MGSFRMRHLALGIGMVLVAAACSSSATPAPSPTAPRAASPTPAATAAPSPSPTAMPTPTPAPSPSEQAVASPSAPPSEAAATASPEASTTPAPSEAPVASESPAPSERPAASEAPVPSVVPSPSGPPGVEGLVELVAGGGTADPKDGGPATGARIQRPTGLAVAPDGTVWIVDSNAGTLLRVTPDGLVHVAATGMSGPQGMALTPDGRPYVAERGTYRIATTNGRGGMKSFAGEEFVSGFKGDGGPARKALLSQPYDVVSDAAGNLYIADTSNQRVRFIDASTGKIRTIAGNGTYGFSGDGGPATAAMLANPEALAVDDAGTVLYIGDYGNQRLRKLDLATGIITTAAGNGGNKSVAYDPALTGPDVSLTRITSVALDADGNVYMPVFYTDKGNLIMRMDPTGALTVVTGAGSSTEPGVPASEWHPQTTEVLKIDPTTGAVLISSNEGRVFRIPGVTTPVAP
jgi:sugar lactone lactonase YvrE